jgi:hypothetical protein
MMRTLLLACLLVLLIANVAHAADVWQEYAPYAKSLEPLPPTPIGTGHLGLLESGKEAQVRFPVLTPLPLAYRVNLSNVVAFTGKGSSYQLVVRRDAPDGKIVYEGPVITNGDAWNDTNREPIDLTGVLKPEDTKAGYIDLYVTGLVTGDGWTLYKHGGGRNLVALAVTLTPEMQKSIEANREMEKRGIALLPLPKECVLGQGTVIVGSAFVPQGFKPKPAVAESLNERAQQLGQTEEPRGSILLTVAGKGATGHANGYVLEIGKRGVSITADDEPGVFYGVQTLCQLMRKRQGGGIEVPALTIRDWPSYPLRGFQYDIARGQTVDLDYCKRMIRETARYKMNCIMYYMEDDYKFEKYPFTGRPGTFTKAKAQELSKYADQYYVMLIPQYESLGHAGAVLSHPEFKDLREGQSAWVFCASEPKVWQFLDDAYAELAEAFPNSKYIHVGGDEFEGPFGTCTRCKAIREKEGIGTLYALHMNKLNELCKKYKRTMMFWPSHRGPSEEESYLTLKNADKLQRDCIPTEWIYHGPVAYPEIEQYQKAGFMDVCVSPAVVSYSVIWPDYPTTFRGIKGFYQAGADRKCGQAICTTWEFMHGALIENSMYGLIYAAECGWSLGQGSRMDYNRRFAANWLGNTSSEAAQLIDDAIYLPIPTTGPAAMWRDGRLVTRIFWSPPESFRRQIMQRDTNPLQHAPELDKVMAEALAKLTPLRKNSTTNAMTLDFGELGLRMMRYDAAKLTAFEQAAQAYANAKPAEAATALRSLLPEVDYFIARYTFAVEKCGAWEGDLKNLQTQRQGLVDLAAKLDALIANPPAQLPSGEEIGLGLKPYALAGHWVPAQMGEEPHEVKFDLESTIKEPGTYRFEFSYTRGAHALKIEKVQLLADGQVVSEDAHHGITGASNSGNVYVLKLDKFGPGKKYELATVIASSGGDDSNGDIWMSKD